RRNGAAHWRPPVPGVLPVAEPREAEAPPGPVVRHTKRLREPSTRGILRPTRSTRDRSRASSTGFRSSRPRTADPGLRAAHQSFAPYRYLPIYLASAYRFVDGCALSGLCSQPLTRIASLHRLAASLLPAGLPTPP